MRKDGENMKIRRRMAVLLLCICFLIPKVQAQPSVKYVALTFDDGPAGKITQRLLDGLERRQVTATFFLCCYRVTEYPQLVRRMAEEGHEIGIHGCSHKYFTQMSKKDLQQEILCTKTAVENLTGISPALIRPPGGLYNKSVQKTAEEEGLAMVLWSLDPEDWDPKQRGKTVQRVAERAKHGDIVLLHDLNYENVQNTLALIDRLHAKGFRFCTVSRLAEMAETTLEPGGIYTAFR